MLKKSVLFVALLLLLSATASVLADSRSFDVSVTVRNTETSNQVEFTVIVKDLKSNDEVFSPKVLTSWGEPAKANSFDKEGREFSFSVAFDKSGKTGTYELVVSKDGKKIQKNSGAFSRQ